MYHIHDFFRGLLLASMAVIVLLAIGTVIFTYSRPEVVIGLLEQLQPTPTPSPLSIKGMAVLGDSQSDEYQADDERGGTYAATTLNWIELLEKKRNVPVGPWGEREEPRRSGYEYNWARTGATTTSMLLSGQHIGVAELVKEGKVNLVIIFIGANDFAPGITESGYETMYDQSLSEDLLNQKINHIVADIRTAVEAVQEAGDAKIMLVKIPDWGNHVGIQIAFPLPHQRDRVTRAVDETNDKLDKMAQELAIKTADPNIFYKNLIDENNGAKIKVGSETTYRLPPGNNPQQLFLDDGIHSGTVFNALFANYLMHELNTKLGTSLKQFSHEEILTISGI